MADVNGKAPNGKTDRQVEIVRRDSRVSIWVHSPESNNGWQIWVPLGELQAELRREQIIE